MVGRGVNRRIFVGLLAGTPLLALSADAARARQDRRIVRLIGEAAGLSEISQRMQFISRALFGTRYQAHTLVGGPRRREEFVVRDDAFDCVTFCEVVLAAALARDIAEFETALRRIRYRNGEVTWHERNHYFSDWSARAVEKDLCRPVALPQTVAIKKTVNWENLGPRQVSIAGIPAGTFLANCAGLRDGDIVGFVSRRPNLDFFHTGLLMVGKDGALILRHASQSRRRVIDQPMAGFMAANKVRHVTLLRPVQKRPGAGSA